MSTEIIDEHHSRRDMRMLESAIRKGFDIPEQLLAAVPRVVGTLALKGKPRDQLGAARVLVEMMKYNQALEPQQPQPTQHVEHHHTHELGPVTADNFEQHRQARLARIAAGG